MMRLALVLLLVASPVLADSTTIGVVYSTDAVQIRRIVVPDSDDQLVKQSWTGPGESLLIIGRDAEITSEVTKATGKAPTKPIAAVVDKGNVESVIMADPALDVLPGKTLVKAYAGVTAGDTYDAGRDTFVIPAHTELDANGIAVLVPASDIPKVAPALAAPLSLRALPR